MDVFEALAQFINDSYEFIKNLPNLFDDFFPRLIQWAIVQWFETQVALIDFLYFDVAEPLLSSLNLSEEISDAFGGIDSDLMSLLNYTGSIEGINIMLSALVTRFVLNFIPGTI